MQMYIYLDPIKLLQEGKITQSECKRIKYLSSRWDRLVTTFLGALVITLAAVQIVDALAFWGAIIGIPLGALVLALEYWINRR